MTGRDSQLRSSRPWFQIRPIGYARTDNRLDLRNENEKLGTLKCCKSSTADGGTTQVRQTESIRAFCCYLFSMTKALQNVYKIITNLKPFSLFFIFLIIFYIMMMVKINFKKLLF